MRAWRKHRALGVVGAFVVTACGHDPVVPTETHSNALPGLSLNIAPGATVQAVDGGGVWYVPDGTNLLPEEGETAEILFEKVGIRDNLKFVVASHQFNGNYSRAKVTWTVQSLDGTVMYVPLQTVQGDSVEGKAIGGKPGGYVEAVGQIFAGPSCDYRIQAAGEHEAWYVGKWRRRSLGEFVDGLSFTVTIPPSFTIPASLKREARSGYVPKMTGSQIVGELRCPEDPVPPQPTGPCIIYEDEYPCELDDPQPLVTTGGGSSEQRLIEANLGPATLVCNYTVYWTSWDGGRTWYKTGQTVDYCYIET